MESMDERKEIARHRAAEWNRSHKSRVSEIQRSYYQRHRAEILAKTNARNAGRLDILAERQREYRKAHPWYNAWVGARQRCCNPKDPGYRWYGGRGIKFLLSKADIKVLWDRDSGALIAPSLDRINPDGNYCLENCRFIERGENSKRAHNGIRAMLRRMSRTLA